MMSSLTQPQSSPSSLPNLDDSDAAAQMDAAVVLVSSSSSQQQSFLSEQPSRSQLSDADSSDDSPSSSPSSPMMMILNLAPASSPPTATNETTTTITLEDVNNKSHSNKETVGTDESLSLLAKKEQVKDATSPHSSSSLQQTSTTCPVADDESLDSASAVTKTMMIPASPCTTKTNCVSTDATDDSVYNNNNNSNDECAVGKKVDEKSDTAATVIYHARRTKLDIIDQLDKDEMSLLASMDMLGASFYQQNNKEEEDASTAAVTKEKTEKDTRRPVLKSTLPSSSTLHQQDADTTNLIIHLDSNKHEKSKAMEKEGCKKQQSSSRRQVSTSTSPLSSKDYHDEDYYDNDQQLKEQLRHAKKEIILRQLTETTLRKELDSLQDKMNVMIQLASVVFMIAAVVEFFIIIIGVGARS